MSTKLTIVTPVFNEEETLPRYVTEVTQTLLDQPDLDASVIFIDDGSRDNSWRQIEKACAADPRFQGLRLSRNFGSHTALSAGFDHVDDDVECIATLACDLQDPPEVINEFVARWRQGARIVWGVRRTRDDSRWRVLASRVFNEGLRRYAMPEGSGFATGSFFLLDRLVLEAVRQFGERNRIVFALVAWTGFEQDRVLYDRRRREAGASGWSFAGMIGAMYDAFVGFSRLPIRLMTLSAAGAFLLAFLVILYLIAVAVSGSPVPGWTSEMLLLSFFFGVQFSLLAIMGQYLARIYIESVERPLYFVSGRAGRGAGTTQTIWDHGAERAH